MTQTDRAMMMGVLQTWQLQGQNTRSHKISDILFCCEMPNHKKMILQRSSTLNNKQINKIHHFNVQNREISSLGKAWRVGMYAVDQEKCINLTLVLNVKLPSLSWESGCQLSGAQVIQHY